MGCEQIQSWASKFAKDGAFS